MRRLIIGPIARDATAIEGNEKPLKKEKKDKAPKKRGRPKKGEVGEPKEEKRLVIQVNQAPFRKPFRISPSPVMWAQRRTLKGYKETWIGHKLHIDTACNGLPLHRFYHFCLPP